MDVQNRQAAKTPDAVFYQVLRQEFNFSLRLARDVLSAAQELLLGQANPERVRPGQVRRVVASLKAPFGPPLAETSKLEITLTVDSGAEDATVMAEQGRESLRRGRILRLIDEALDQGGVLTQEDLAQVLGVDARTIRRDVQALKEAGELLHTRGQLKGVGRGQTHKVKIIELWLDRVGYDVISRQVHHSPQAIRRYVSTFLRLALLHREGKDHKEIAFLTQSSARLVADYLVIYEAAMQNETRRAKLEEEIERVGGSQTSGAAQAAQKGGQTA
ncbi:MAG: DUF1670 domain-containing protein [Chloroflexota bacterium]